MMFLPRASQSRSLKVVVLVVFVVLVVLVLLLLFWRHFTKTFLLAIETCLSTLDGPFTYKNRRKTCRGSKI